MLLAIPEHEIQKQGTGNILSVCWRQWLTELRLARRGIAFRTTSIPKVLDAYQAMSETEFDAINARQDWANWRTLPRALDGHVPDRPLRVLDLGCGTGGSTRVLAFYCPRGSIITGYEWIPSLVSIARQRRYRHRTGVLVNVDFVCQSVTDGLPLHHHGRPLKSGSVDVVNASGIVGHHFSPKTVRPLLQEIRHLLKRGGIAVLDVGPTLPARQLRSLMLAAGFISRGHFRSWLGDRTGTMVFQSHIPRKALSRQARVPLAYSPDRMTSSADSSSVDQGRRDGDRG